MITARLSWNDLPRGARTTVNTPPSRSDGHGFVAEGTAEHEPGQPGAAGDDEVDEPPLRAAVLAHRQHSTQCCAVAQRACRLPVGPSPPNAVLSRGAFFEACHTQDYVPASVCVPREIRWPLAAAKGPALDSGSRGPDPQVLRDIRGPVATVAGQVETLGRLEGGGLFLGWPPVAGPRL